MNKPTEFNFSVDSALLRELGEKLVSTVQVALAELVKNAYDADATTVRVTITPSPTGGPKIVIEDNGTGMTPKQVGEFWMRIGTTNKEDHPRSVLYGRPRTGRKGVGRFACRRLGRRLELETCAVLDDRNSGKRTAKTSVHFDWNSFTPGTTVESIPCKGFTQTSAGVGSPGTKLIIENAELDEWQTRSFDYLNRQLAVMAGNTGAKRPGFKEDPGFSVHLQVAGIDERPIDLREKVIDASWGTLEAEIQEDGCAIFTLHAFGIGGKRTFRTSPRFKSIFGAALRIGILPTQKSDGVRDPSLLANYVLNRLIDDWGGVQVRYNGFRMYPYGNPGDDWLKIDADRGRRLGRPEASELLKFASSMQKVDVSRALLNMLGMRNHLGHVDVPSTILGLEPRLDRQGFIENETFLLLQSFVRMAIEWATIHREAYIRQRASSEAQQAIEELSPILNVDPKRLEGDVTPRATQYLRKEISRLVTTLPIEEQAETRQSLFRTVKALEAISADSQSQLRHLRLVASASTLTLLFAHEVRSSISSLGAGSARLRSIAKKVPEYKEELTSLSQQLGSTQAQLARLVEMTGIVGAFRSDQRLVDVDIRSAIDKAASCFRLVVENYGIHIDVDNVKPALLIGPMIVGEVYSILINLLSNAIKSLIAAGGARKLIRIWTEEAGRKAYLRIADNGLGLDVKHFADVFTPFISDPSGLLYDRLEENANPEDAAAFGTGSGLGLSIARDIARARGGDIRFINPDDGWAACVEIELP